MVAKETKTLRIKRVYHHLAGPSSVLMLGVKEVEAAFCRRRVFGKIGPLRRVLFFK